VRSPQHKDRRVLRQVMNAAFMIHCSRQGQHARIALVLGPIHPPMHPVQYTAL
jgi:hypothetical protein